ncbi:MAG: hypothetical protein CSYNP_02800 [Syntrophus sp. SKADARSKE-3]|nr:hypothetical protein [Syntrophus sp. SKADARSKE-3]
MSRRVDVKAILRSENRRFIIAGAVVFILAVEGRDITMEQALRLVDGLVEGRQRS